MSSPNPMNDPENERQDDDLLRMEDDARRYEDEQAVMAEMEKGMDERGLDWQAHWNRVEQDMRDNRNFWKLWEARWQSK